VSTGYFIVFLEKYENQIESFVVTGIINFPVESEIVFDPETVLIVTASRGFLLK